MRARIRVTTNNDIAYIWWSVPAKIPGALGFSIHRELKSGATTPLTAWVGFERREERFERTKEYGRMAHSVLSMEGCLPPGAAPRGNLKDA
jgi:hypothetical protein